MPGKMSLKEGFVDGDVLQPNDSLLFLDLQNPIHQQERVAVRQSLHDVVYRIHPLLLSTGFDHLAHQRHCPAMAWLYSYDSRPNPRACKRQIADAVHRLVSHKLVLPAQCAAQYVVIVENDRVVERGALDQSLRAKRIDLVHEAKRPRSRQLVGERLLIDCKSARLLSD